jgi:hypothetical protein
VSSNPICVLLVLMVFIMILSGVIVICVIISINYYYRQSEVGIKYVNSDLFETRVVFTSTFDTPHIPS